jgi:DnaJ-class molecular chaperone
VDYTERCPVCQGDGQVPDEQVTGGKSTCPKCLGSGRIWK